MHYMAETNKTQQGLGVLSNVHPPPPFLAPIPTRTFCMGGLWKKCAKSWGGRPQACLVWEESASSGANTWWEYENKSSNKSSNCFFFSEPNWLLINRRFSSSKMKNFYSALCSNNIITTITFLGLSWSSVTCSKLVPKRPQLVRLMRKEVVTLSL